MRVIKNTDDIRPGYVIHDLPDDDEWIDTTEMGASGQRLVGRRTGDTIAVESGLDGRPVAVRTRGGA